MADEKKEYKVGELSKKDMLKLLEEGDKLEILKRNLEDPEYAEEAYKALQKEAIKYLTEVKFDGNEEPDLTKEQYESLDPKEQAERRAAIVERRISSGLEEAIMGLRKNSNGLLMKEGKPDKSLASIASHKVIQDNVSEKNEKDAKYFASYEAIKKIGERAKKGEKVGFEDEKIELELIQEGVEYAEMERLRKMGHSDKYAKIGAQLHSTSPNVLKKAIKSKNKNKFIENGAKRKMKKIEIEMDLKKDEKIEDRAAAYVADTLKSVAKHKDVRLQQAVGQLYYQSQTGYAFAGRDYLEAFPKKDKKK